MILENHNYPNAPGWKTDQTETSREAARKETSRAGTLRERLLRLPERRAING